MVGVTIVIRAFSSKHSHYFATSSLKHFFVGTKLGDFCEWGIKIVLRSGVTLLPCASHNVHKN